jgi:hypothetical protein
VTLAKSARPYGIVSTSILSAGIALLSSRIDRVLFYWLASGSILLALTFSSRSVDSLLSRFGRGVERPGNPATVSGSQQQAAGQLTI